MLKLGPRTSPKSLRKLAATLTVVICGIVGTLQLFIFLFGFLPANLKFSYSDEVCMPGTLLPSLHEYEQDSAHLSPEGVLSIAGFPIASRKLCVDQKSLPLANSKQQLSINYFGIPFYEKRIYINYDQFPAVLAARDSDRPVSVLRPLRFSLSSGDKFFDYELLVGDKAASCTKDNDTVLCDLTDLTLKHGIPYKYRLQRSYKGDPIEVAKSGTINIIEPVSLTQSLIGADGVLYQNPDYITFTASKTLSMESFPRVILKTADEEKIIDSSFINLSETEIRVNLGGKLARKTAYSLIIDKVAALDGGSLEAPYRLDFTTSGGPKVVSISIGQVSVELGTDPVIYFDQTLAVKDFSASVSLMNGNNPVRFTTWVNGSSLGIVPTDYLPFCTTLSLYLDEKIESAFGITGDSSYVYNFRTKCYRVTSIGSSVQGRSINAYWFGNGGTLLLYIGNMHGVEYSSKYTMDSWIADLDAQFPKIPKEVTVVVIPTLNPDGFANGSRLNANGVDINRNFATSDWRPDISPGGGPILPTAGGSAPNSEPETKAIANFVGAYRPRLTISYHSQGSYVIANDAGDSRAQAANYSDSTNYRYFDGDNYGDAFDYEVSGTFDDWMNQAHGLPELLVELPSHGTNYYWANSSALWNTLNTR